MLNAGINEIILIAQDSTVYGKDLYGTPQLFKLLEKIEAIIREFELSRDKNQKEIEGFYPSKFHETSLET